MGFNGTPAILQEHFSGVGIDKTVDKMLQFIRKDKESLFVFKLSRAILKGNADGRNTDDIADVLYNWIIKRIQYFWDPRKVEWVMDTENILRVGAGDCDDFTVISCALLESMGIKTRVTIAQVGKKSWNHVFCEYYSPASGEWVTFDTCIQKYVGWKAKGILQTKSFNV